jgi:hypothetical protein
MENPDFPQSNEAKMHLSKSRFSEFKKCPRAFYFKEHLAHKDDHIRELADKQTPPLVRHEILRNSVIEYVKSNSIDTAGVILEFRSQMVDFGFDDEVTIPQAQIIETALNNFVDDWANIKKDFEVAYLHQGNPTEFIYNRTPFMAMPEIVLRKEKQLRIISLKGTSQNVFFRRM